MQIEKQILKLFQEKKLTLGVAESCTGGAVSARLTALPGASSYFKGGVVAYSNFVKQKVLGVSHSLIQEKTAASEDVAFAMAKGVKEVLEVDCALATTGIAGPTTDEKQTPIGTVYIAVVTTNSAECFLYHFEGDRQAIINQTVNQSLMLIKNIALVI